VKVLDIQAIINRSILLLTCW